LSDLFEVVSDPDRYGKRWVRRFTGSLIPFSAGVGAVERLMDPTMRDAQKYLDGIRERVPGWSTTLPARLNIWGEPIVLEGGWGPDIVSPFYQSTIKDNKAADEILAQEVRISMPARSVGNVELTPAEYHQYVKLSAGLGIEEQTGSKSLKHALISMMKDPFYQQQTGGPDGGKALMIRQKVQAFRAIAKEELLIQNAELASLVQKAREVRARNLTPQGE